MGCPQWTRATPGRHLPVAACDGGIRPHVDLELSGVRSITTTCAASGPPATAVTVNRTARPPGSSSGHTWSASPCARSGRVRTVGVPPPADTRSRPVAGLIVATITVSSGAHVAPRGESTRASVSDGPPVIATFFSVVLLSTKPTHWPSGEMNGPRGLPLEDLDGVERVERADEQPRSVGADIDNAGAIRRNRQVANDTVDAQCRRTRRRDVSRTTRGGDSFGCVTSQTTLVTVVATSAPIPNAAM